MSLWLLDVNRVGSICKYYIKMPYEAIEILYYKLCFRLSKEEKEQCKENVTSLTQTVLSDNQHDIYMITQH